MNETFPPVQVFLVILALNVCAALVMHRLFDAFEAWVWRRFDRWKASQHQRDEER